MIKKGLSGIGVFFLYLISLLPLWFLYLIAYVLFIIIYYLVGYRRRVVQENLRNAFPEKSDDWRKDIEKKYYRYLADLIVEVIKMFTISEAQIRKRIVVNEDLVDKYFAENRSIIGAVGHYGNWEWGALRFSLVTQHRRIIVYKPLNNITFDNAFFRIRSRFGATLIAMRNTLRKMVEYRRELSITVLVSDQTPGVNEAKHFTQFLNQPTAVFLGIEKLAKTLDSVVLFCDIRRIKRGYYHCNFVPLFENLKDTVDMEITNAHVKYLEEVIKAEPQYWLWSHRRWKFKPEDTN